MTDPRRLWLVGSLACVLAAGCEESFTPYHELEGFRVLAIRADKPALREGESALLDALLFVEEGDVAEARFAWSWCPLRLPASEGGDCAVTEAQVALLLGLPADSVSFDLGSAASPEFVYPGTAAAVRAACANAAGEAVQVVLDCTGGLPISVRADVTHGEQTIRVHKELRLVFDDTSPNQNPSLGETSFRLRDSDDAFTPWSEDMPAGLVLGDAYELKVAVEMAAAESFVPAATEVEPHPAARRESLFITWFTTTGSVLYPRTWFLDDMTKFAELGEDEWSLPKAGDEPEGTARLFLVLRDERGGIDWLERRVELRR